MLVIGMGRIGRMFRALNIDVVPAREFLDGDQACLTSTDLVVHAAGPAGDAACCENPGGAFAAHYMLTDRLVDWALERGDRRLVLLGTVAPNIGFYGPLKRAAIANAQRRTVGEAQSRLLIIECGQVIGEGIDPLGSGVIGEFVLAAVKGQPIEVFGGQQTIRYTSLHGLIDLICTNRWPNVRILSPVSPPIPVLDLAKICARIAYLRFGVLENIVEWTAPLTPSYEAPTGVILPVQDCATTLLKWMCEIHAIESRS